MIHLNTNSIKKLVQLSGQTCLLPFYHAVSNQNLSYTNKLYPPRSIANFKHDLEVLLSLFKPISLQELINNTNSGKKNTFNFHLTFDDGLANFYHEVAPILLEKKIPATVFINTAFVDNKDLFFRYKASLLWQYYLESNTEVKAIFKDFITQTGSQKSVDLFLFNINYQEKKVLDALAKEVGFSFSDFLEKEQPYLSTKQLKELITQGFTIGSHSVDHPLFCDLSLEEQLQQITDSFHWIEQNLAIDYKAFSFPFEDNNISKAFFDKANLDISFGTYGIKKDGIRNNLQRISFELARENTLSHIQEAYSRYYAKRLFGKHIIKRS